jgi:hypothetical protein
VVYLRSRGLPGGLRRPREGPRRALGGLPGPPDPPGPGSNNLKTYTFCRALVSGRVDGFGHRSGPNRWQSQPAKVGCEATRFCAASFATVWGRFLVPPDICIYELSRGPPDPQNYLLRGVSGVRGPAGQFIFTCSAAPGFDAQHRRLLDILRCKTIGYSGYRY